MTAMEVKDDILFLLSKERDAAKLEKIRAFIAALVLENMPKEVEEPAATYQVTGKSKAVKQGAPKKGDIKKRKDLTHRKNIRILSSRLKSVVEGKVYEVLFDKRNEEKYIINESGEKVLFDKNIFSCEYV